MKQKTINLRKSTWLLLTLLAIFVGASPTWAGTITEDFESLTVDGTTLSNGWFVQGGTLKSTVTSITSSSSWGNNAGDYNYEMVSKGANSTSTSICNYENSNTNKYLIIPVELTGKIKFYAGGCRTSGTRYVKVYRVTYDSEKSTYSIGSQIGSTAWPNARGTSSAAPNWLANKQEVDLGSEHSMVAFLLQGSAIDEVEAETYVFTPYVEPASISASPTGDSADITWTAGETDETVTAWDLEYKKSSEDSWTEVHGLSASTFSYTLSDLNSSTSYDVRVKAVYSENESEWKATTFKTAKVAVPATGFTDDFETDKGWDLINGSVPNKWVRGTGTNNGGSYALYISSDGATYPTSSYGGASLVYATKLFSFEAGNYTISYDWMCNGEVGYSAYDFMRVGLIPGDTELAASTSYSSLGSGSTLPSGWTMWLDGGSYLGGSTTWATKSVDFTIETAGNYQVVFAWRNDGSSGSSPAAIDNFKIIGAAPVLELGGDVVGTTLAFGSVAETTNKTIRITNSGKVAMENISLTETADADNVFAYAELPKTTLAANEYMDVQVTFSGSSAKDYTGTFQVAADDCDPIDVTVTATYSNSAATMALTIGEAAVGASVAFGNVGKQATKTFTVTNDGDQTLNVTSIVSNNTTDFTVSPSSLEIAGHTSETFTVTFVYPNEDPVLDIEKTANITVTASNAGIDPVQFAVTGTRIEQWSEDFSGNALPDGWENENSSYWSFSNGVAVGSYAYNSNYGLITPLLTVEEGASLSFEARATSTYENLVITMSKNGGAWEACKTISYSNLPTTMTTFTIDGLEAGNYKFRFRNGSFELDNFQGFKRNMNDPKLGIYSDAECTEAVATSVTKDFGFATETQTATYYIKNDGTGTMTLSLGDAPAGLTQTLDKTSVAAGEHATLTITMPAANKGYNGGNVVVTAANLGTFTVAVSGVIVEEGKMNLDFSTATIPTTWTTNSWSKNASGYVEVGYSGSPVTMQTSNLTAVAGEDLVVIAKMSYTSSSYSFGVKYKKTDAEEWSDLIAAANIGTNYVMLHGTIAEAGTYQLQFNGQYTQIQRIYGLSVPQEPVMVVYDGEELAAATYNFGNVSDEADATWTLTVKNEGKAELTGLAAALTGDDAEHYSVEVSATSVAVDGSTTITVTQLKDNVGAHNATLTISATGLDNKVITLSGNTYDHTKLFVDFENGNLPTGWTTNSWTVATTSGNKHARAGFTASSLITTPMTVGAKETLTFKAKRQYSNTAPTFQIRYTIDGGVTWTEYVDYASQVTSGDFTDITLSGIDAETVVVEIYGRYVDIDDIYGFTPTTAPMIALKENSAVVENESTKEFGTLTAEATATYTLTNNGNGAMVSTVGIKGDATVVISGEGEGVTIDGNNVTLAAGKSATITLTMPYEAPFEEKDGAMTIFTDGWVGDFIVNYTATTVDPTALYEDFSGNAKPEGWYQETSGWTFTLGTAHVYTGVDKTLITEQYGAEAGKNVLTFDAKLQSNYAAGELKVYTSADRKTWTLAKTVTLTEEIQAVSLDALAAGSYYVKFESTNASIDNLAGLKKLTAPAHDLYVSATTFPTTTLLPNAVAGVNATATVHSLRANETGVYAKLFFDEDVIATAEAKAIDLNASATFTITANVPAEEGTYAAKIVVYYSDESVAWETATTDVTIAHTRTLAITDFARDGEGTMDANAQNQISPVFNVTVQNNGTTNYTGPTVKVFNGEVEVGTATSDAIVEPGETTELNVTATNMSAGEGGELSFTAKAYWNDVEFSYDTPVVITVNAAAPKFELAVKGGDTVEDGDAVAFGLVKAATTKTFTISNSGTAALELVSIVAPTGYSATAVTEENKTIAVSGTLDIDVTLAAEQGKKSGDLVITYKVDASNNKTFTLALSGRSVAADTWVETFDTEIPASWENGIDSNKWIWDEDNKMAYSQGYNVERALTTPRLAAEKDEVLTYDLSFRYEGYNVKVQYSTDHVVWYDYDVIGYGDAGEQEFVAPATGNYYLRFLATRYAQLDNFVGFKFNSKSLVLDETVEPTIENDLYDNIALNRKFIAGWNTVCLPFQIDDFEELFGTGAKAYYMSSHNDGTLYFDKLASREAGKPFILYVPEAISEPINLKYVNIPKTALTAGYDYHENAGTAYFRGTYAPIAAGEWTKNDPSDIIYVLTPAAKIAQAGLSASTKGFRAYFDMPKDSPVKAMMFEDVETGIISVDNEIMRNGENEKIYNLAGQRVQKAQKGINIVNGKKVIIK